MGEKIVLIDGHSILHRAFFGIPDLTNAEGLHTNAVYGFLNILFKILEEEKPDYLTVLSTWFTVQVRRLPMLFSLIKILQVYISPDQLKYSMIFGLLS